MRWPDKPSDIGKLSDKDLKYASRMVDVASRRDLTVKGMGNIIGMLAMFSLEMLRRNYSKSEIYYSLFSSTRPFPERGLMLPMPIKYSQAIDILGVII